MGIAFNLFVHTVKLPGDTSLLSTQYLLVPIIFALVSAPLSGWLADAKLGNYKVFRVGVVLLFISAVMNCLFLILEALVLENNYVLEGIKFCALWSVFAVGCSAYIVTTLPLGLDQMPDASSSSITSFIAWLVFTVFISTFVYNFIHLPNTYFLSISEKDLSLFCALLSTFCLSVVLILIFIFSPKWLIIEPKSAQSLKTIYQVLKFAAKHKAPLNRSAFTYWEEDIPSRIDLGKSKYGGPFTTEQVEDVKTVLRLLVISLPLFFVFILSSFHTYEPNVTIQHSVIYTFTSRIFNGSSTYVILTTLVVEFLIYPLAKNNFPSILKRIAAVPLIFSVVSFICLILELTNYFTESRDNLIEWSVYFLHDSINGILFQMLFTSLLEFMCAQSPYNMRGLLVSFIFPIMLLSMLVDPKIPDFLRHSSCCTQPWFPLISFSVKTLTCFIGFLLFCVVAHWYKMRVRDEDYSPQRVVEEVYDRYLTAAVAQSRSYGTTNT